MFSDTVTYVDFNGNERSEELFFNISETESLKFLTSVEGGYDAYLQKVLDEFDNMKVEDDHSRVQAVTKVLDVYEDIILAGYGEKSDDGKRFMKSEGITNNFKCSAAYEALLLKFFEDPEYGVKFVVAVLPNNTGMSGDEIVASVKQDSNTIDLTDRFKAKIEEKKTEALPAE